MKKFKRILLKLSGEQFAGSKKFGIDQEFVNNIAQELKEVAEDTNAQIAIIVGGGNFIRGANLASHGLERATGDYMGMIATILNGMALVDTLELNGQPARLQTRLHVQSVAEPYIRRRAIRHMEKGRIVVVAGGTGNPFVTTDTAAVSTALELDCDVVLKATKVDGVYDKDPSKYKDAKKLKTITYAKALQNPEIAVMDNAAISLAMDNNMPIIVFDLLKRGNLKEVTQGKTIGSKVSS
ncbi:MAG TPA: UMP kinase [Candidatus Saccharimonadales bacterium]|nr:UMP kinase [Candidatus Saccharimonadales bacterium]